MSAYVDVDVETCPQCTGPAELELDGDVAVYVCKDRDCGCEFGHRKANQQDGMCQAGIVRIEPQQAAPVFIGSIGRRPQG